VVDESRVDHRPGQAEVPSGLCHRPGPFGDRASRRGARPNVPAGIFGTDSVNEDRRRRFLAPERTNDCCCTEYVEITAVG
jgi:hypothetical protein